MTAAVRSQKGGKKHPARNLKLPPRKKNTTCMGFRGKQSTQTPIKTPFNLPTPSTTFVRELRPTEVCIPPNYECHFPIKDHELHWWGGGNPTSRHSKAPKKLKQVWFTCWNKTQPNGKKKICAHGRGAFNDIQGAISQSKTPYCTLPLMFLMQYKLSVHNTRFCDFHKGFIKSL